jgi:hypothetical protein
MGLMAKHAGKVVNRILNNGEEEAVTSDLPLSSVASFAEKTRFAGISTISNLTSDLRLSSFQATHTSRSSEIQRE